MTEFINNIFATVFGNNIILATILIAMIPIIEIRGAIPFATNSKFWGNLCMTNWQAFGWSLLGSCAIVPVIALIAMPIINWLKRTKLFGKLANGIETRIKNKASTINGANEQGKKFSKAYWKKVIGVFIFVAIPLPLTGVWTGTCVALFLGIDFISTCLSVIAGNVVAGILIALILEFFPWLNDWLFFIFLALVVVFVAYEIIRHFIEKKKVHTNTDTSSDSQSKE